MTKFPSKITVLMSPSRLRRRQRRWRHLQGQLI